MRGVGITSNRAGAISSSDEAKAAFLRCVLSQKKAVIGIQSGALAFEVAYRRHSLSLRKNWLTTLKCFPMSGSSPHSVVISANGLDHEAGGAARSAGIS